MHLVDGGGSAIPAIGLGTWNLRGQVATRMVEQAIAAGYRHVDTAAMYDNEREVGAGLAAAGIPRHEIFLTTKVWPDRFADGDLQASARQSLERLRVDQVDLLLLHWPSPHVPLAQTMGALNEVAREGLARHIGVSNFTTALVAEAVALAETPLACNQVEYHPGLDQSAALAAARANGMAVVAYSPLGRGDLARHPVLEAIGRAHGKSATQVALRWLVQQPGVAAIPRTSNAGRAAANIDVFDFALGADEMQAVFDLAHPDGRLVNPAGIAPEWD